MVGKHTLHDVRPDELRMKPRSPYLFSNVERANINLNMKIQPNVTLLRVITPRRMYAVCMQYVCSICMQYVGSMYAVYVGSICMQYVGSMYAVCMQYVGSMYAACTCSHAS